MSKYILKRILISVVTLFVIIFLLFLMLEFMPGSPFNDEKLTESQRALLNAKYGLNQPFLKRFFNYLRLMIFHGDFGISYTIQQNVPVSRVIGDRVLISIRIGLQAVLLGTLIGFVLGAVAAIKRNTIYDTLTTIISVIGVSIPSYVFALGLAFFVGFKMKILPITYDIDAPFYSSILPTIALSLFVVATITRFLRGEMIEVLKSDYVLLAESKGVSYVMLILKHGFRNAMIPVITVLTPLVVGLMTGSLVIEKIFGIPGLGSLLITAIQVNDYNVILAISFIYSILFIFIILIVDILYGIIDPRIRLAGGSTNET